MTLSRLSLWLAAAAASVLVGGGAVAGGSDRGLLGGPRQGLPLDPELLPPDTGPGDCVTRRVTGPGGAYRWDRVECDGERGWIGFDQWGYGRRPIDVETLPAHADRHDEQRQARRFEEHHAHAGGDGGYESRDPGPRDDRYGPPRAQYIDYRYAGRDADGYLVWPGKQP